MGQSFKIHGIYDQRTLKLLKLKGLRDFGFEFSPKSFNFIQEHVFLDELVPSLDPSDRIHLHFTRSNDPMIKKVVEDLMKSGVAKEQVFIQCDEWSEPPQNLGVNYHLTYHKELNTDYCKSPFFAGLFFDFSFFDELKGQNTLNNFVSNFYTRFSGVLDNKVIALNLDWNDNVFPSLYDYFDFDLLSFPINSQIEVCYRNVDLKKLTHEMSIIEKNKLNSQRF